MDKYLQQPVRIAYLSSIRYSCTLRHTVIATGGLPRLGSLLCQSDCSLPLTQTTQHNVYPFLPFCLAQSLAAFLVYSIVPFVISLLQREIIYSAGQCAFEMWRHPAAIKLLSSASMLGYRG
jgi:hypothetical protein